MQKGDTGIADPSSMKAFSALTKEEREALADQARRLASNDDDLNKEEIWQGIAQTLETERWLVQGFYGELLLLPVGISPKESYLSLIEAENGCYHIYDSVYRTGQLIYKVYPSGKVIMENPRNQEVPSRAVVQWPTLAPDNEILLPENGLIISAMGDEPKASDVPSVSPSWMFLAADLQLWAPLYEEMSPPPNRIIVVRDASGQLTLESVGVTNTLYASVSPDGIMKYHFESVADNTIYYWPLFTQDGKIALAPPGYVVPNKLKTPERMILTKNGGAIISGPQLPK